VASASGTATTYRDTSTTPGTTYYYEVAAVNSAGESTRSNVAGPVTASGSSDNGQ
jgi:chitodextrinase